MAVWDKDLRAAAVVAAFLLDSNVSRGRRFGGLRTDRLVLEQAAPPADRGARVVLLNGLDASVWHRTAAASGDRRGGRPRCAAEFV